MRSPRRHTCSALRCFYLAKLQSGPRPTPSIFDMLESPKEATAETVTKFKLAFLERYSLRLAHDSTTIDIEDLKQEPNESLFSYYRRAAAFLALKGGKDNRDILLRQSNDVSLLTTA